MSEGFVPDNTYGAVMQAGWHPGPPEEYRFFGIASGKKVDRKGILPIAAWRCGSCGLVQLYAPAPSTRRK
jgi:hypothetical protein